MKPTKGKYSKCGCEFLGSSYYVSKVCPKHTAEEARKAEREAYWRGCWERAARIMPRAKMWANGQGAAGTVGSTALMLCLGYKIWTQAPDPGTGTPRPSKYRYRRTHNWAGQHYLTNKNRGTKPKGWRAVMLERYAGPHGQALARMKMARLGMLDEFPVWPNQ